MLGVPLFMVPTPFETKVLHTLIVLATRGTVMLPFFAKSATVSAGGHHLVLGK